MRAWLSLAYFSKDLFSLASFWAASASFFDSSALNLASASCSAFNLASISFAFFWAAS